MNKILTLRCGIPELNEKLIEIRPFVADSREFLVCSCLDARKTGTVSLNGTERLFIRLLWSTRYLAALLSLSIQKLHNIGAF